MQKIPKPQEFYLHNPWGEKPFARVTYIAATFALCMFLLLTTSFCGNPPSSHVSRPGIGGPASQNQQQGSQQGSGTSIQVVAHSSPSKTNQPTATTTVTTTTTTSSSTSGRRVNIPYFSTAVPFNQTAIFWFGDVTATDTFTDVRMGYNSSELYIDLRTFDSSVWYDSNTAAPNLANGDNANIYLSTTGQSSVPDQHSFDFQAGPSGYVIRGNYQQASVGNGTAWTVTNIPFTAISGWRGQGFNGLPDFGWSETFHIPFSSLGFSGAPAQGTVWKLAIQMHNRDDAANTPLPDKWWPDDAPGTLSPKSWGTLGFGYPVYQSPQPSNTTGYIIRNGLNNQVVTDGMVGGSLGCGNGLPRWSQWATQSYPQAEHVNIQNEEDISDFVCFSKWYITFPLSSLPSGKSLVNAKVTLYEYANAGVQGQPNPSFIQVAVVNEDWNPATLAWNTAPLIQENIGSILVNTKSQPVIPPPGLAATWDVSVAAAQAYRTGQPLRLVFYSTDNQYNTGKYFWSSYVGPWNAQGRPTLQVTLGQ